MMVSESESRGASGTSSGSVSESRVTVAVEVSLFEPSIRAAVVEPVAGEGGDDGSVELSVAHVSFMYEAVIQFPRSTHHPHPSSSPPFPPPSSPFR